MNYKNIHDNLIKLCQTTHHKDRLTKRNPNDVRLKDDEIYTEKHHILPKHDGGKNEARNLVIVLPEEHYLLHLLRYMYKKDRNDFLAVRFMHNGYIFKQKIENGSFLNKICVHRHMVAKFRKNIGWHTEEGKKSISNARKGKVSVVDSLTGESIGAVDVNHPNILNGKWVHPTKGKHTYCDDKGNKYYVTKFEAKELNLISITKFNKQNVGSKNPMFKEMTPENVNRIFNLIPLSIEDNHFKVNVFMKLAKKEFSEFKKLSYVWFKNNFQSWDNLLNLYNKKHNTNYEYNRFFRFTSQKLKLAEANRKKV